MLITDFCQILSGVSFPKKPVSDEHTDYLLLESNAIDDNRRIKSSLLKSISKAQFPLPSNWLRDGDILIRAKGTKHQAILFQENFSIPLVPTSYFLIIRIAGGDICSAEFLTCLLNQPSYQNKLSRLAGGATVKHLTKARLTALDVCIPPGNSQLLYVELNQLIEREQFLEDQLSSLRKEYYSTSLANLLEAGI